MGRSIVFATAALCAAARITLCVGKNGSFTPLLCFRAGVRSFPMSDLIQRANAHKAAAAEMLRISELELSLARWQNRLGQIADSLKRCEVLEADTFDVSDPNATMVPPAEREATWAPPPTSMATTAPCATPDPVYMGLPDSYPPPSMMPAPQPTPSTSIPPPPPLPAPPIFTPAPVEEVRAAAAVAPAAPPIWVPPTMPVAPSPTASARHLPPKPASACSAPFVPPPLPPPPLLSSDSRPAASDLGASAAASDNVTPAPYAAVPSSSSAWPPYSHPPPSVSAAPPPPALSVAAHPALATSGASREVPFADHAAPRPAPLPADRASADKPPRKGSCLASSPGAVPPRMLASAAAPIAYGGHASNGSVRHSLAAPDASPARSSRSTSRQPSLAPPAGPAPLPFLQEGDWCSTSLRAPSLPPSQQPTPQPPPPPRSTLPPPPPPPALPAGPLGIFAAPAAFQQTSCAAGSDGEEYEVGGGGTTLRLSLSDPRLLTAMAGAGVRPSETNPPSYWRQSEPLHQPPLQLSSTPQAAATMSAPHAPPVPPNTAPAVPFPHPEPRPVQHIPRAAGGRRRRTTTMVTKAEFREIQSARGQGKDLVFASAGAPSGLGGAGVSEDRRRLMSVLLTDAELESLQAARGDVQ